MTLSTVVLPAGPCDVGRQVRYRPEPVTHHGGTYVAAGRRTVAGDWRCARPELCDDDAPFGVWIGPAGLPEDHVLVCPSCGLDCT